MLPYHAVLVRSILVLQQCLNTTLHHEFNHQQPVAVLPQHLKPFTLILEDDLLHTGEVQLSTVTGTEQIRTQCDSM
jgi:hypothetical protein